MKPIHLLVLVYTVARQAPVTSGQHQTNITLSNQLPQVTTKPIHHTNIIPALAEGPNEATSPQTSILSTRNKTSSSNLDSVHNNDGSYDRGKRILDQNQSHPPQPSESPTQAVHTHNEESPSPHTDGTSEGSEVSGPSGFPTEMSLNLAQDDDEVVITWTFQSQDPRISQFEVNYKMNDEEEVHSMRVGLKTREFHLHSLHNDEDYMICVQALTSNGMLVHEVCQHWTVNSMKFIVGILAGGIFLLPVMSVLAWILVRDRRVRREYGALIYAKTHQQECQAFLHKGSTAPDEMKGAPSDNSYTKTSLQAGLTLEPPAPSKPQSRYHMVAGQEATLAQTGQLAVIKSLDPPSSADQCDIMVNGTGRHDDTDHVVVHF